MPEGGLARQSAVPGPRDAPGTLSEGGGFLATWAPEQNRRWKPGPGPRPGFPRSLRGSPPSCSEAVGRSRPALKNSHAVGPQVGLVTGRHTPLPPSRPEGAAGEASCVELVGATGADPGPSHSPLRALGQRLERCALGRPRPALEARGSGPVPHPRAPPPALRRGASGTRRPLDSLPLSAVSSPFSLVLLPKIGDENFPRWL